MELRRAWALGMAVGLACGCAGDSPTLERPETARPAIARSQEPIRTNARYPAPSPLLLAGSGPLPKNTPKMAESDTPLPINFATALQLAGARPLDVQIAGRQVAAAAALYDRARLLWVPNLVLGTDYFAHTGPQQNFSGDIVNQNRNTFMAGLGPNIVFSFSDAVYAPLAARQDLKARQAIQQAAINDLSLQVAEAYFTVQQARGELAGALLAEKHAVELARRAVELSKSLAPPPEENRAKVELARRRQVALLARERWRIASAQLARLLRLDPSAVIEPMEPPFLPVTVIDATVALDGLIPIALNSRPELAEHQALVQATLARLKQEKIRPLVPSLALRSASTNPAGTLGYGVFGGGINDQLKNFSGRFDIDAQLLWEFQALGFGNRARMNERKAEYEIATLDLFRTQDRIAAEVAQAFAEVRSAAERLNQAEPALREAIDLVNKSLDGLGQVHRVGDVVLLVVRPQEAVAAVQSLGQANADFFTAVADYNRAQFRLYRALGHPAQCLAGAMPPAPAEPVAVSEQKPPVPPINALVPTIDASVPPANGPRAGPGSPLPLSPVPRIPSIEPVEPETGAAVVEPRAPVGSVPNLSPGRGG
jgi:outer membrane protein TolC